MLRRHPTRVEERADVADEYEAYLMEKKERSDKTNAFQPAGHGGAEADAMATRQEKRRQETRMRIGLNSSN